MSEWTKTIPPDGFHWIKYRTEKGFRVLPCEVSRIGNAIIVRTLRNDTFVAGPEHGGPELSYDGVPDKSIRFGPAIPKPK